MLKRGLLFLGVLVAAVVIIGVGYFLHNEPKPGTPLTFAHIQWDDLHNFYEPVLAGFYNRETGQVLSNEIGFDRVDLNGDGVDEIVSFDQSTCQAQQDKCILSLFVARNGIPGIYDRISKGYDTWTMSADLASGGIRVLNTTTNGYRDIEFIGPVIFHRWNPATNSDSSTTFPYMSIFKWNGQEYVGTPIYRWFFF